MPDPVVVPAAPTKVPFWQTNEGKKDIAMIAGCVLDVINAFSTKIPPGLCTAAGIILGRIINIFRNPDATTLTPVVKALLFAIGLSLLASQSQAQSILRFNGLSLGPEAVNGPVTGTFLAPLNQFSYNPFVLDQGQITVGQNVTVSVAYGIMWGRFSPDASVKTNVVGDPDFILDAFAGDGFLASNGSNGIYINRGVFGFGISIPHLLGNLAPNVCFPMAGGPVMVGVAVIGPLDFLNGFGIIQIH